MSNVSRPGAAPRPVLATALALVTVAALTAGSCGGDDDGVRLGAVSRADVTETVDAPATVTAKAVATVTSPADGTLVSLAVAPGQVVAAGQVLAVVDSPAAQQRLAQASSALDALRGGGGGFGGTDLTTVQRRTDAAATTSFAAARDAAGQIADPTLRTALLAQVEAAERGYQEAAASSRALVASVQNGFAGIGQAMTALTTAQQTQAQAAYDLAKGTVDALTLRAPVAGTVQLGGPTQASSGGLADLLSAAGGGSTTALAAAAAGPAAGGGPGGSGAPAGPGVDPVPGLGGRVGAGTTVLTVVDTSELGLLAQVDETDVLLVRPGVSAEVELEAVPGARYQGSVGTVDMLPVGTGAGSGGVAYRVRITLRSGRLATGGDAPAPRPGMSAVAHLAVRSATGAVTVPAAAVFTADGRDAVWLVRRGKAVRTPVTVGVSGPDLVEITTGVSTGDRVVVRGADRVRAGQQVR